MISSSLSIRVTKRVVMAICFDIVIFFLVIKYKPLGFAARGVCIASGALRVCFVLFRRAAKPTFGAEDRFCHCPTNAGRRLLGPNHRLPAAYDGLLIAYDDLPAPNDDESRLRRNSFAA